MDKFHYKVHKVHKVNKVKKIKKSKACPDIGLVIGTFGSSSLIHIHLEQRHRLYPNLKTLVHDDCSGDVLLPKLCKKYGCDFYSTDHRHGHVHGDLLVYRNGLLWAEKNNIQYLIKMSRRFIPLIDWIPGFVKLIKETQHITFSNVCVASGWGFRTDCIGLKVSAWLPLVKTMEMDAENRVGISLFEGYYHQLAIRLKDKMGLQSVFATWDLLGNNRCGRSDKRLWHNANGISEYMELYGKLRLPYPYHRMW